MGHVGFSPVLIDGEDIGWFGLGLVSVASDQQRKGVGSALIETGLLLLKARGAKGCVVLGDPAYYRRFGFAALPTLRYGDVPAGYFQSLSLCDEPAHSEVAYHPSFGAA